MISRSSAAISSVTPTARGWCCTRATRWISPAPILTRLAEGPLRFVSVDGGHTAEITAHDLATAEAAIAEGGIIVVDDVFNEQWPGVGDGVRRYFERRPNLVPFAIGANKTYFCRPSHRDIYHDAAAAAARPSRPPSSWASPSPSSSSCVRD